MGYKEAIEIWKDGEKQELINDFYAEFTYNSNKIENSDTKWSDVQHIFKGKAVRRFRVNNIAMKAWNILMKCRKQLFRSTIIEIDMCINTLLKKQTDVD